MGKLNYTNRKTWGSKLGATIKKDILKRVPEGSGRTSVKDVHLELSICGKLLGNDGLGLVCEALCRTIESGATKLDELSIAENDITAQGLEHLMKVIKLSSKDLKDLNLSGNQISIETNDDARIWEDFLASFKEVNNLRKLDLSKNPLGPTRAFETLLRCYSRENPINFLHSLYSPLEDTSDDDLDGDLGQDYDGAGESDLVLAHKLQSLQMLRESSASPKTFNSLESTSSKSGRLARGFTHSLLTAVSTPISTLTELHGLRSIPFIILSNTGMEDISALHLSYLLAHHSLPQRILPLLPPLKSPSLVDHWDELDQYPTGIVYLPNEKLTSLGIKALEIADSNRGGSTSPILTKQSPSFRRISDASSVGSPTKIKGGYFGPQLTIVGSTNEIDRSRSKIQGTVLREGGPKKIELWISAIRALVLTRALLLDEEPVTSTSPVLSGSSSVRTSTEGPPSPLATTPSTAATCLTPPSPQNLSPPSYKTYRLSNHHVESPRRTRSLPGGLSESLWQRIIGYAADPYGTMSTKQLKNVVDWGMQRETLMREKEFAGKLPSIQIWRFLEGLECLTYEV